LGGIWPFNGVIFTDEDLLPSTVTDRPLQPYHQPLQNLTRTSEYHISNWYSDISYQISTSGLETRPSASQGNRHHVSPVEIRPILIEEACKETRKRKSRVNAVLTDTPVTTALQAEVEAHAEPVKRKTLFSDRQEKAQKSKQLYKKVRRGR
jgi:hypothetical protein